MISFKSFRFGNAELLIISFVVLLVLLGIGIATVPAVTDWYGSLTTAWTQLALRYGYWGAFFSALVGSLTIVIVFPYTIIIIFLAAQGLNPLYLGLLMGLGATIGELSGYLIGWSGARYVQRKKPESYDAVQGIVASRPRALQWLLFLFAITPLPDDVLFIPLGVLRYPWWKIVLPTLSGKLISGIVITSVGYSFKHTIDTASAGTAEAVISQFGMLAVIALMVYLFLKLDWQAIMRRLIKTDPDPPASPPAMDSTV